VELTAGRERFSLRRTLVVVQVRSLVGAGCRRTAFTRSLSKLANVDTGFQQDGILIARADLPSLEFG
jgi:hypothetical protein